MAGTRRAAGLPPLPLGEGALLPPLPLGEGRGEGVAPDSPVPPEQVDTALTLPSPGGRGFDSGLAREMNAIGAAARAAAQQLGTATSGSKTMALGEAAAAIRAARADILAANRRDLDAARKQRLSAAMLDRLALDEPRIEAMARGLEDIAALPEPVGRVLAEWTQPNGLRFQRLSVPLGVIGIIYESRPNVTADAGGICLKSGNAAILRGGSESFHSSAAIAAGLRRGLSAARPPPAANHPAPPRGPHAPAPMLPPAGPSPPIP